MARSVDRPSAWLLSARDQWHWRGQGRPPFAVEPGPDRFSVWDYSRPPVLAPDTRQVAIRWGDVEVARTRRAIRALETSHPPSFYVPWDDVVRRFFSRRKARRSASGRGRPVSGRWSKGSVVSHELRGATRNHWLVPKYSRTASPSTRVIWTAQWKARSCGRSPAGSTAAGSRRS